MANLPKLLFPRAALTFWGALAATLNALGRVAIAPLVIQPLFDRVLITMSSGRSSNRSHRPLSSSGDR